MTRARRRRSLPPAPPSGQITNLLSVTKPSLPSGKTTQKPHDANHGSHLLAKAEALARMTFELNIRTVAAQANRLEQDLRPLVASTVQDKEYRQENERRLQEIWREILAVKAREEGVRDVQGDLKEDFEKVQQEVGDFKQIIKEEVRDVKGMVEDLLAQVATLPTMRDVTEALNNLPPTQLIDFPETAEEDSGPSSREVAKGRIRATIESTRRWNRDHKTTTLPESTFTANYLKQQAKRDAGVAQLLQKAVQKRIRKRTSRSHSRPRSIEEFCQDVTWVDIIETVEDALVRRDEEAIGALR